MVLFEWQLVWFPILFGWKGKYTGLKNNWLFCCEISLICKVNYLHLCTLNSFTFKRFYDWSESKNIFLLTRIGLMQPTAPCGAGYVCSSGANSSSPTDGATGYICPMGAYCPAGSGQETKCPVGTFSNQTGLHNVSSCEQCSPGWYCNVQGQYCSHIGRKKCKDIFFW